MKSYLNESSAQSLKYNGKITMLGLGLSALSSSQTVAQPPTFEEVVYFPTVYDATSITIGDIDGDGLLDVVISEMQGNETRRSISYFKNAGDNTFIHQGAAVFGCEMPSHLWAGDLDGDHDTDLTWLNTTETNPWFCVYLNKGDGTGGKLTKYPVTAVPSQLKHEDLDNDGDLDAVIIHDNATTQAITILSNDKGTFKQTGHFNLTKETHTDMALGDLDGDGDIDIAALDLYADYTFYYGWCWKTYSSQVVSLMNDGTGKFSPVAPFWLPYNGGNTSFARKILLGDVDGDTFPDIVILADETRSSSDGVSEILILANRGGVWGYDEALRRYVADYGVSDAMELVDFDYDGDLDILFDSGIYTSYLENYGNFEFGPQINIPTNVRGVTEYAVNDINNDGKLDIAISSETGMYILMNNTPYSGLSLAHSSLIRGQDSTFTIENARPGETVYLLYSKNGYGNSNGIPQLGGISLSLDDTILFAGSARADESGTATIDIPIPNNAPEQNLVFQAVIRRGSQGKNSVKTPISNARIK